MMLSPLKRGGKVGKMVLVAFAFLMLAILLSTFAYGLYELAQSDPVRGGAALENMIALFFHGIFAFLLVWGLSQAVFTIFFSNDLELLLSLPITRKDIFSYKVIEATFYNIRLSFLFLIPILLVLGLYQKAPLYYYLITVIVTLSMASIPGAIGIIVAAFLSSRIPRARFKGILTVVSSLMGIAIWVGMNQIDQRVFSKSDGTSSEMLAATHFVNSPAFNFLPSGWAFKATLNGAGGNLGESLIYLLPLIACSLILNYIALVSTSRYYSKGITEEIAAPSSATSLTFGSGGSPILAHIRRDMILLWRDSGVLMQSLVMAVILLLFPFVAGSSLEELSLGSISPWASIFAAFFGGQVGSRMMPLERLAFWRNLVIPGGRQMAIYSKIVIGLIFVTVIILTISVIHLAAAKVHGIDGFILPVLFSWMGFAIGLPVGAIWGNFAWDNPRRMLKGGGGFIFAFALMISGMAMYGLIYLSYRYLAQFVNPILIILVFSLGFLSISFIVTALKLLNMEWTPDV
jgi:ABC-2 type transport system permease protein